MKKIIILFSILVIISNLTLAQQDILKGEDLKKYGDNLKWVKVWTDNQFIVMSTKGTIKSSNRLGYVFFLIHPDQGIVSNHVVEGEITSFSQLFSVDEKTFTVFYKKYEKMKSSYYAVSFSKDSEKVETNKITQDLGQTNNEAMFHLVKDNQLLFGSIAKDKTKFAIRKIAKDGSANIVYKFNLPDSLYKILTNVTTISQDFRKSYQGNAFSFENGIRIIITYNSLNRLKVHFLDFDLLNETITQTNYLVDGSNKSIGAFSLGEIIFLVKSKVKPYRNSFVYEYQLDILKYPSLELIKNYSFNNSSTEIPFKTSKFFESVYNSNLYYSNYKFKNHDQDKAPIQEILKGLNKGIPYVKAIQTSDGNYLLDIGSELDLVASNGSKLTTNNFFGCLNNKLEPCARQVEKNNPREKIQVYLESVQKENPEHLVFGKRFIVLYFKKKKELSLKAF